MALRPGNRVGHYDVLELLGEGGMGAVFRAHDPRLARDVALKVIRADVATDPDRLARFAREARLLGALTHPNIATVHGLEDAGGERVLVMELVSGPTLDERLRAGPLDVDEALRIGGAIAAGVEAAHEHGIIHRDLKPSNIKLTPDGGVKLLDFGLAKALATEISVSRGPTISSGGTADGLVLGTIAYMSPEQARGKDLDTRTDIWSFGCVLFDMLTGTTAFGGASVSDTIAAILTRDPDWSRLPAHLPPSIARLLRRCLVKDAHTRLRDIGDARIEIEDALAHAADPAVAGPARTPRARGSLTSAAAIALLAVGAASGAFGAWAWTRRSAVATRPVTVRFALPLPPVQRLAGTDFPAIAMSPVDTHVAYIASQGGHQELFVHDMAAPASEGTAIEGTEGAIGPFFSPDGQWIAFFAGGKLRKVAVAGGPVRDIADAPIGFGGSWGPDGTIVFAPDNGSAIWRVSADGGAATPITTLDAAHGEFSHRWPEFLPDGTRILFTVGTEGSWDSATIAVQGIDGGARRTVVKGGSAPHYLADGRVLYARAGALFAVTLDGSATAVRADARQAALVEDVAESLDGAAQVSVTRGGSLLYVARKDAAGARTLAWVDRSGRIQPLAAPRRAYQSPRLSPDGNTIAVSIPTGERDELWTYDVPHAALTQFTFNGGTAATWSADGRRILFSAPKDGTPVVFARALDGSDNDERQGHSARAQVPASIAPDGTIACVEYEGSVRDIVLLNSRNPEPRRFLASSAAESSPAFSPDGGYLAFVSDRSGRNEVYVTSAVDTSRSMQISINGGTEPVWRRDGAEIFFRSGRRMMSAAVRPRPAFTVGAASLLFEGDFDTGTLGRAGYDVSADGARLLMVHTEGNDQPLRQLEVVLGWLGSGFRPAADR